jgi:serine protease
VRYVNSSLKVCVISVATWTAVASTGRPTGAQQTELSTEQHEFAQAHAQDAGRVLGFAEAMRERSPFMPGEVLVRFVPGSEPSRQASALRILRADVNEQNSHWIGDALHITTPDITDAEHAAELLRRQPEVLYAQPNYIRRNKLTPNDTNYGSQWNFEAINLPQAWNINAGARADVIVAVVDSGLTTTTNTFNFRIWDGRAFRVLPVPFSNAADFDHGRVEKGREFAFGWRWTTPSGDTLLFDSEGHGTHVAGTIAQQTNNNAGYAGVAYQTTLLPLKVCWSYWDSQLALSSLGTPGLTDPEGEGCPDDAQAQAIRHAADNGAKVINISIGGPRAAPLIRDALQYAVSRGAFVAIAAGNEAEDGNPTVYPAAYAPTIEGVMAVGAVNRRSARASYSSFGSYVEIVAPGGGDGPLADEIWQMGPMQSDLRFELLAPRMDRYQSLPNSGTSMAAPHVAGVAALLYSQGIRTPAAIESAIKRFARDLGTSGADPEYGAGLVDARAALRGLGLSR